MEGIFFTISEIEGIEKSYPLFYQLITTYVCGGDVQNIPADIKQQVISISSSLVKVQLMHGTRDLYNVFDKYNIICTLERGIANIDEWYLSYYISVPGEPKMISESFEVEGDFAAMRIKVEKVMFMRAIGILEEQLKTKKDDNDTSKRGS